MRPKPSVWTLRATLVPRGTHRKRLKPLTPRGRVVTATAIVNFRRQTIVNFRAMVARPPPSPMVNFPHASTVRRRRPLRRFRVDCRGLLPSGTSARRVMTRPCRSNATFYLRCTAVQLYSYENHYYEYRYGRIVLQLSTTTSAVQRYSCTATKITTMNTGTVG